MARKLIDYVPSLESNEANGDTQVELEYIFFGKIVDMEELKKADRSEEQEQWEIRQDKHGKSPYFGSVRVRAIDGTKFILCCKTMKGTDDGRLETEIEVTEDMFKQFKKLADSGMIKTRYFYDIPDGGGVWEVDVYKTATGEVEPWCKIDLEVKSRKAEVPPFPIQLTDVHDIQPPKRSKEEEAFCRKLLDEKFILKNAFDK